MHQSYIVLRMCLSPTYFLLQEELTKLIRYCLMLRCTNRVNSYQNLVELARRHCDFRATLLSSR